jgi:hypothetical protein
MRGRRHTIRHSTRWGGRTGPGIEEEKNEDRTGRNKNSMDLGRALGGRGMAIVEARRIRKTAN